MTNGFLAYSLMFSVLLILLVILLIETGGKDD